MFGEFIRISLSDDGTKVVYKQRNDAEFEFVYKTVQQLVINTLLTPFQSCRY